jgi:hypothetical protein
VGLTLHDISVKVLLCIEVAMGLAASCWPVDTSCRWCIVSEDAATPVAAMTKPAVVVAAVLKALALRARTPASEGLLWSAVIQLMLLSLVRSAAA